jgi:hypothetical protein
MYIHQWNDKEGVAGLMDMVRRGCERLYKPCPQMGTYKLRPKSEEPEAKTGVRSRFAKMTANQRDEALLLAKSGKHTITEIARLIGHTKSATYKWVVSNNKITTLRDGRISENKRRTT